MKKNIFTFSLLFAIVFIPNHLYAQWTISGNDIANSNSGKVSIGAPSNPFFAQNEKLNVYGTGFFSKELTIGSFSNGMEPTPQNPVSPTLRVLGYAYVTRLGIGISPNWGAALDVNGLIRATEVRVCLNQGCDFVFEPDYNLMGLKDLKDFIQTNKHLPEVAPAAVMEDEGIDLSVMNALLLQKIEELTLYVISLHEEIELLKQY